ncbi:multidrug efflux SMR transporter [Avibacterium sp. 20-15]|uniref:DMT family transporter n=1 Tax=unclassified Avibacterium TaxID=2685287 RepID=UPI00202625B0|nr:MULTISPECIES: multidrug efflux SMR transporter [unclassified Avibacterium]MCW9732584.1 multidrug efflux SMR transporter [Avibacterium sp. 20-15]URL04736.1 multidrug efflux SMR transporter [Avibacterium sp. 20-132]
MAWLYLVCAGLLEIGWPIGLKMATQPNKVVLGSLLAVVFMVGSGLLLYLAQRTIPMGTAYAVWTGIGAAGAFIVGVLCCNDALTFWRALGAIMIVSGVIVLKLASH